MFAKNKRREISRRLFCDVVSTIKFGYQFWRVAGEWLVMLRPLSSTGSKADWIATVPAGDTQPKVALSL